MNDLVKMADNAIANYLDGNYDALDNALAPHQSSGSVGYMRFNGNTGDLIIGKSEIGSLPSVWAIHCYQAKAQWICFQNAKPIDRKNALIIEGGFSVLPKLQDLPPVEKIKSMDGWKQQVVVPAFDMEGEHGQMEFSLHADTERRPIWGLLNAWADRTKLKRTPDIEYFVPVVEITNENFDTDGGIKWAPIFTIDHWLTDADMENLQNNSLSDAEVDDEEEDAPPKKATKPAKKGERFNNRIGGRTA